MKIRKDNFAQSYCAQRGIKTEQFVEAMLSHVLYPHARLLMSPLDAISKKRLFAPDRELVEDLGNAGSIRSVANTLSRMPWYYGDRWGIRNDLRLRISSRRVMTTARASFKG